MVVVTHTDLVHHACRWLAGKHRCRPVFAEFQHLYSDEMPDAIGWTRRLTHVVECKVSRSDFRKDAKKRHVLAGDCIGQRRWYLCPPDLIRPDEAEFAACGLLYLMPRGVRVVLKAPNRDPSKKAIREEIDILRQAVKRHAGKLMTWQSDSYAFTKVTTT